METPNVSSKLNAPDTHFRSAGSLPIPKMIDPNHMGTHGPSTMGASLAESIARRVFLENNSKSNANETPRASKLIDFNSDSNQYSPNTLNNQEITSQNAENIFPVEVNTVSNKESNLNEYLNGVASDQHMLE